MTADVGETSTVQENVRPDCSDRVRETGARAARRSAMPTGGAILRLRVCPETRPLKCRSEWEGEAPAEPQAEWAGPVRSTRSRGSVPARERVGTMVAESSRRGSAGVSPSRRNTPSGQRSQGGGQAPFSAGSVLRHKGREGRKWCLTPNLPCQSRPFGERLPPSVSGETLRRSPPQARPSDTRRSGR